MPRVPEKNPERKSRRNTPQRRIILEELRNTSHHPTAAELYETVKQRLPRISLGTVYRNLEVLQQDGQIHRLEWAGGEARFDAVTTRHYHIRCRECGSVRDLPMNQIHDHPAFNPRNFDTMTVEAGGFLIDGFQLEYSGVCPECRSHSTKEM